MAQPDLGTPKLALDVQVFADTTDESKTTITSIEPDSGIESVHRELIRGIDPAAACTSVSVDGQPIAEPRDISMFDRELTTNFTEARRQAIVKLATNRVLLLFNRVVYCRS